MHDFFFYPMCHTKVSRDNARGILIIPVFTQTDLVPDRYGHGGIPVIIMSVQGVNNIPAFRRGSILLPL